jgi:hypothetical protein
MKLIIAGGRDYQFNIRDSFALRALCDFLKVTEIVSGGAYGADACGEEWAESQEIPVTIFPADWKKHGPAAGPIRNKQMAEYADAVVLFPGDKGTQSMYDEARKANIHIFDWRN